MTNAKPNPVVRLLPSLTDVAFLLPAAFLFLVMKGAHTLLGDGDTGWHVRTGEWMLRTGHIPHADMFSYTMPGRPWFAWEWLWDLGFGWLHQRWGMAAVVAVSLLVLCLTFSILFRLVYRKCANPFIAIGVTALVAAGSSIHYLARPHLFTLLFVVIFCGILERGSEGNRRLIWLLPALTVVWTNVHGGFLIGLFLVGAYAAGNLAEWLLGTDAERRRVGLADGKRFLAVTCACVLATFVNPYFYHLHVHIYHYLRDPYLWKNISEYQPLNFQGPVAVLFAEPMLALTVLAAAWTTYQHRFAHAIVILACAHSALVATRNLPVFLMVAAPFIAEMLAAAVGAVKRAAVPEWLRRAVTRFDAAAAEFAAVDRLPRLPLVRAAAATLLAGAFFVNTSSPLLRPEYDPKDYPAKTLALLRSPETHRIFTHDEWGDYLIYNLYPSRKVFVDGRSDFYGPDFGEKYLDVMRVKSDWEQNLKQYSVDTILLPVDEALAGALKESQKWRVIYDDGMAIVFRAKSPATAPGSSIAGRRAPEGPDSEISTQNKVTVSGDSSCQRVTPRTRS